MREAVCLSLRLIMWLTCSSAARNNSFFTPLRKLVTLSVCYFQSLKITAVGVVRRKGVRNRSGHHINLSSLLNKWIKRAICLADSIPRARTQSAVFHLRSDGFMNLHPELIKQRDSSLTHRPCVCLSLLLIHSFTSVDLQAQNIRRVGRRPAMETGRWHGQRWRVYKSKTETGRTRWDETLLTKV